MPILTQNSEMFSDSWLLILIRIKNSNLRRRSSRCGTANCISTKLQFIMPWVRATFTPSLSQVRLLSTGQSWQDSFLRLQIIFARTKEFFENQKKSTICAKMFIIALFFEYLTQNENYHILALIVITAKGPFK